jgi:hypothetical protein
MSKSKFIPLSEHPAIVKCYVCGKEFPSADMLNIGNSTFRCKKHRQSTIMKASAPSTHAGNVGKKTWKIDIRIQGTIEEV